MEGPTRLLEWRRERMRDARLYFVCEARPRGEDPRPLLEAALRGGADLIQLRDKDLGDDELVAAAAPFRDAAREHDGLFVLNDRPDLVEACGSDGVHVGQDDLPVAEARRTAGPNALVGLSTHAPEQIDAAVAADGDDRPDQISVGPVWQTPTKAGRPATGLDLVRYAAAHAVGIPWFAIGGIATTNVGEVVAAGAERVVVVRAIRDAADPEAAARGLRDALGGSSTLRLMRAAIDGFNRGSEGLPELSRLFTETAEIRPLRYALEGTVYRGPQAPQRFIRDTEDVWRSSVFELEELRERGDVALALGRYRTRGRGSDVESAAPIAVVCETVGGKITRLRTYLDRSEALRAFAAAGDDGE